MREDDLAAFNWLDSEFEDAAFNEMWSPDAAFDWIWMMYDADWETLNKAWSERSAGWRAVCAYVLGRGPTNQSQILLNRALQDANPEVVREAALSLNLLAERESWI